MISLYSEHRTWLHSVPAAAKLCAMAVAGTALCLTNQVEAMIAAAAACAALFGSLGQATKPVRRMVASLLLMALLVAVFHSLLGRPDVGIPSALRLAGTSFLGVSLTITTRYTEWVSVFERVLAPLAWTGLRADRFALQLALMLRFVDVFFVQWKRLDEAHRLRTGRSGGFYLLAPLSIQMLLTARRVSDSLRVRLRDW